MNKVAQGKEQEQGQDKGQVENKQNVAPIRTLLWSPKGSGEHYHGPAQFTYRLFSSAPAGKVELTLAHGFPQQAQYPLFKAQHCIADLGTGPLERVAFIRKGCRWVQQHAQDYDIFHGISGYQHIVSPAAVAEKHGVPAVLFLITHQGDLADKPGWRKVLALPRRRRKAVGRLSGLIAMSQVMADELLAYGIPEEKIARIPMGVNTQVFAPAVAPVVDSAVIDRTVIDSPANNNLVKSSPDLKRELRARLKWRDMPTVIFSGTLVKRKRPHLLIDALGLLKAKGIECQLVFAGPESDESYVAAMKQRARNLGVDGLIVWFGFATNIVELYQASDIFCLPSAAEGMAAALIEAMACELAPIVTPISGSIDVVSDGENGCIVQGDGAEIANALAHYIESPRDLLDHSRAARALVLSKYSNESVFSAYERMYRRIIAGGFAAE